MIEQRIIEALKMISQRLEGQRVKWVLVGSASLALQGVDIAPKDIDILTDEGGAFRINELLKEYEDRAVEFATSRFFQSYFGRFRINGVEVEAMGELKVRLGDEWVSMSERMTSPKMVEVEGLRIPVSPLQEQLESYRRLGREKDEFRVQRIREALEGQALVD